MWFKNLQIFRITEWKSTPAELEALLSSRALQHCAGFDMQSTGWLQPKDGIFVHSQGGQMLVALGIEKKLLPATVIAQYAKARAEEIEEKQGYKPGRKQMKEIREAVTEELLPRAFALRRSTHAWIDPKGGWLVVDSASQAKAEEVLEALSKSSVEFSSSLVRTRISPTAAMTAWLAGSDVPSAFTIDLDCELRAREDEKAKVRYAHHSLDSEEIRKHIGAGKDVTKLAMTWSDKISFILHDNLQIKRISPLDILKEQAEASEDAFDGDFAIMTGELSRLLPDLVDALGGEDIAQG